MGISTLSSIDQYGLTLVLGGGEVTPIDMATAYGVFATEGVKHTTTGILKVEDKNGKVLEEYKDEATRILPEETTRLISSVLSDNNARAPIFGSNSYLNFPGMSNIAVKTGTTNDYKDAWIVGYTPKISIAAWVGNNDNRPIQKKAAGFIVAPMWNEIMRKAIELYPAENFNQPAPIDPNIKPVIRGVWNPTDSFGNPTNQNIHDILHWVDKDNPLGAQPQSPYADPQYSLWESGVQAWVAQQGFTFNNNNQQPLSGDQFKITSPQDNDTLSENSLAYVIVTLQGGLLNSGEVYINKEKVGTIDIATNSFSFTPSEISKLKTNNNTLRVVVEDEAGNVYEDTIKFDVR
jgi:penicillin-binding protein 1A